MAYFARAIPAVQTMARLAEASNRMSQARIVPRYAHVSGELQRHEQRLGDASMHLARLAAAAAGRWAEGQAWQQGKGMFMAGPGTSGRLHVRRRKLGGTGISNLLRARLAHL